MLNVETDFLCAEWIRSGYVAVPVTLYVMTERTVFRQEPGTDREYTDTGKDFFQVSGSQFFCAGIR